jgi:hypothetical protein
MADTTGPETIERFPHASYDQFASRGTVPNFLPLLAERFEPAAGLPVGQVWPIRDDLERRVRHLPGQLSVAAR